MPDDTGMEKSALDLYFIDKEGQNFKATVFYEPYFYLDVKDQRRMLEILASADRQPKTPFLKVGDKVAMEAFDPSGRSVFGRLEHKVVAG